MSGSRMGLGGPQPAITECGQRSSQGEQGPRDRDPGVSSAHPPRPDPPESGHNQNDISLRKLFGKRNEIMIAMIIPKPRTMYNTD